MLLNTPTALFQQYAITGHFGYDPNLTHENRLDFFNNVSGYTANLSFPERGAVDYIVIFETEAQKQEKHFSEEELQALSREKVVELAEIHCPYFMGDAEGESTEELIGRLLCVSHEDYYTTHYSDVSRWYDLESDFHISGSSQGDDIAVKDLSTHKVNTPECLTQGLFGTPLAGYVTIYDNGKEVGDFHFHEYFTDPDGLWEKETKEALITSIMKSYGNEPYAEGLEAFLRDLLPDSYEDLIWFD